MPLRKLARHLVLKTVSGLRLNDLALMLQKKTLQNATLQKTALQKNNSARVVVVEMHETLSGDADKLRRQLDWVARHFTIITPDLFARALETRTRSWPESRPAVLFTFDDGRECNYLVAAPILESYGARAIFFVVTEFIGLEGDAAKNYYYSKIDIRNIAPPADTEEIWKPMLPAQLSDLVRRGHWIGSHTLSHASLARLSTSESQREIEVSSQQIGRWTGKPVDAFAWPYSWQAISRESWESVKRTYRFCFSPCPGTTQPALDSPFLVWRKEVESYYSPAEYQFMYSGLVDPVWAGKRKQLKAMLGLANTR